MVVVLVVVVVVVGGRVVVVVLVVVDCVWQGVCATSSQSPSPSNGGSAQGHVGAQGSSSRSHVSDMTFQRQVQLLEHCGWGVVVVLVGAGVVVGANVVV